MLFLPMRNSLLLMEVLSFEVMHEKVNSEKYIDIIKTKALPIINVNYQRPIAWLIGLLFNPCFEADHKLFTNH